MARLAAGGASGQKGWMKPGYPLAFPGMRIGLLGGSFDPPHEGHVRITHEALRRFRLDRVWWLVSPGNPLKAHGPAALPARIAAARAMLADPRVVVTGIEADFGTRLTADTLARVQDLWPGVRFVWLMGSDNLVQFDQWTRWREIADRMPIGVLARPESRGAARHARAATILRGARLAQDRAGALADLPPPVWVLVNIPMTDASSSAIRAGRAGGVA